MGDQGDLVVLGDSRGFAVACASDFPTSSSKGYTYRSLFPIAYNCLMSVLARCAVFGSVRQPVSCLKKSPIVPSSPVAHGSRSALSLTA